MRPKYVSIEVASARGVAERWRTQYERDNGSWLNTASGSSKDVYDKLCALGQNPPIDKVAEAICNQSWSYISCDGCSDYVERAVRLSDTYSEGKRYCATCIAEAHQILIGDQK